MYFAVDQPGHAGNVYMRVTPDAESYGEKIQAVCVLGPDAGDRFLYDRDLSCTLLVMGTAPAFSRA
jgi:hypothetical protein